MTKSLEHSGAHFFSFMYHKARVRSISRLERSVPILPFNLLNGFARDDSDIRFKRDKRACTFDMDSVTIVSRLQRCILQRPTLISQIRLHARAKSYLVSLMQL